MAENNAALPESIGRAFNHETREPHENTHVCILVAPPGAGEKLGPSDAGGPFDSLPWSESQNDDPGNGLALSKNAHWAFDEGLWSVGADHRIMIVAKRFTEHAPEGLRLGSYANRLLQFAAGVTLRPHDRYFASHRKYHGVR
jgi:hypothetical protein